MHNRDCMWSTGQRGSLDLGTGCLLVEAICSNPRSVKIWLVWSERAPYMARVTASNSAHSTDWPSRELPVLGLHWEAATTEGPRCDRRAQENSGFTGCWSGRKGFPGVAPLFHKNQGDSCH